MNNDLLTFTWNLTESVGIRLQETGSSSLVDF